MVPREPVEYPLGGSIIMFLVFSLGNYIGTWEVYLVRVSLESTCGLTIGTKE